VVDIFEESGLQAIVDLAKKLLEKPVMDETFYSNVRRYRESLAKTFLSINMYKYDDILKKYISISNKAVEIFIKVFSNINSISVNEALIKLSGILGLSIQGNGCFLIELKEGAEIKGKYRGPGSIVCIDPEKAAHLVLAGMASPLWSGIEKVMEVSQTSI